MVDARALQNLTRFDKLVNPDGTATDFFMRLLQAKNVLTADLQTVVDHLDAFQINTTAPIAGGPKVLGSDPNITLTHANSGVTANTYGDATHVPQITVDAKGHVTDVVEVAISGGGGGDYTLIAQQTITSGDTVKTFSSIPGTYTDLIVVVRGNITGADSYLKINFNGDTGANYKYELDSRFEYDSQAGAVNNAIVGDWQGTTNNNFINCCETTIYGYATALDKALMGRSFGFGGGNFYSRHISGMWLSAAAIVSLSVALSTAATFTGGSISLYGRN